MAVMTQGVPHVQSFPFRPRFLREAVVTPFEDALLVDGTEQPQLLRGGAIRGLLPDLIPLMDGSRELADLQHALPGVSAAQVRAAVSLLFNSGLLEDGTSDGAIKFLPHSETLGFFRRFLGATRWNRSGPEAYHKLQTAEIAIIEPAGECRGAEILQSLLIKTGVEDVRLFNHESYKTFRLSNHPMIVSLALTGEDDEWHTELDNWCYERHIPWLRGVVDTNKNYADIGPYFITGESPCYHCFREIHSRPSHLTDPAGQVVNASAEFWISMIAVEVTYLLSRIAPTVTAMGFRRYNLSRWESKDLRSFRLPGCSRCRPFAKEPGANTARSRRLIDTALVFEDYVGLASRQLIDPKSDQERSRIGSALGRQAKQLSVCKQYALNPQVPKLGGCVLDSTSDGSTARSQLTIDDLATLLKLTAGLRVSREGDDQLHRWAATAGNLGSVELYLAIRHIDGLPSGIYFYQPQEHSLALLKWRDETIGMDDFISRIVPHDLLGLPDALVIFTGAFHRVARKYGPFGYRLVNLDAGAAVSQLHLVAKSLEIYSRTAISWPDDLIANQLKLEPLDEQSTAVVALYGEARPPDQESSESSSHLRSGCPRSMKPVRDFFELPLAEIVQRLYRESRKEEGELLLNGFAIPPELAHRTLDGLPATALPDPVRSGEGVGSILTRRATVRRYTADSVSLGQLGTMLWHAHGGDASDWPEEHQEGQILQFIAVVHRVNDLPAGVYFYDSKNQCLRFLISALSAAETTELFIQSDFATAPLSIWIIGNLAASCARHGAWGHRQLLLRAGAAAHRLWTAALTLGLSGAIVAGVVPGAARLHLGLDGYKQAGLVAFTTGFKLIRPRS